MKQFFYAFLMMGLLLACKASKDSYKYESEHLKITKLSDKVFVHTTYLATKSFGKVACNGMLVIDKKEAIVFDTPTKNSVSEELIKWIRETKKATVKAVVINHFHVDCLGGLAAFHAQDIPSYASQQTIALATADNSTIPQHSFDKTLELQVGKQSVINTYFGEGHTKDNIVSYLPEEEILFGGCLIKSLRASKGNLADANPTAWSNTVKKIQVAYPNLKYVIPGHGKVGGDDLLDYTVALFEVK